MRPITGVVQQQAMEIAKDMKSLRHEFRAGAIKRDDADTSANIAGKELKALAIILADQALDAAIERRIPNPIPPALTAP